MQPIDTAGTRYDGRTIFYHWAVAVLVVLQWVVAQLIGYIPRGPLRTDVWSLHIVVGLVIGVLLVGRIVWRLTGGRRLPPADRPALEIVARATHYALYGLLIAVVTLGVFTAWANGNNIFNVFQIPLLDPQNPKLGDDFFLGWHALAANAILILSGAHAAAALFHHYVWQDSVLARMLPWAERAAASRTSAAE